MNPTFFPRIRITALRGQVVIIAMTIAIATAQLTYFAPSRLQAQGKKWR